MEGFAATTDDELYEYIFTLTDSGKNVTGDKDLFGFLAIQKVPAGK